MHADSPGCRLASYNCLSSTGNVWKQNKMTDNTLQLFLINFKLNGNDLGYKKGVKEQIFLWFKNFKVLLKGYYKTVLEGKKSHLIALFLYKT